MSDYIQMYENPRFPFEKEEAERLAGNLRTVATYENGIARWSTNGSIIPADCARFAAHIGMPIDLVATAETRDAETEIFFEDYRKNYRGPSEEEMAEMRAAFGPGETVVNIITGHKIKL